MYHAARALAAATIVFLLLGAGNVSGLLLARATARDRQWAVRKAMAASPIRLPAAVVGEAAPLVALGLAASAGVARGVLTQIESMLFTSTSGLGENWTVEDPSVLHLDGTSRVQTVEAGDVSGLETAPRRLRDAVSNRAAKCSCAKCSMANATAARNSGWTSRPLGYLTPSGTTPRFHNCCGRQATKPFGFAAVWRAGNRRPSFSGKG